MALTALARKGMTKRDAAGNQYRMLQRSISFCVLIATSFVMGGVSASSSNEGSLPAIDEQAVPKLPAVFLNLHIDSVVNGKTQRFFLDSNAAAFVAEKQGANIHLDIVPTSQGAVLSVLKYAKAVARDSAPVTVLPTTMQSEIPGNVAEYFWQLGVALPTNGKSATVELKLVPAKIPAAGTPALLSSCTSHGGSSNAVESNSSLAQGWAFLHEAVMAENQVETLAFSFELVCDDRAATVITGVFGFDRQPESIVVSLPRPKHSTGNENVGAIIDPIKTNLLLDAERLAKGLAPTIESPDLIVQTEKPTVRNIVLNEQGVGEIVETEKTDDGNILVLAKGSDSAIDLRSHSSTSVLQSLPSQLTENLWVTTGELIEYKLRLPEQYGLNPKKVRFVTNELPEGAQVLANLDGSNTLFWVPTGMHIGKTLVKYHVLDLDGKRMIQNVDLAIDVLPVASVSGMQGSTPTLHVSSQSGSTARNEQQAKMALRSVSKTESVGISKITFDEINQVDAGETVEFDIHAKGGTTPKLNLKGVPHNAEVRYTTEGSATVRWTPGSDDRGYTNMTFVAVDSEDSQVFSEKTLNLEVINPDRKTGFAHWSNEDFNESAAILNAANQ